MKRKLGFTLFELMIVVAVIGLLAAFAIPAFVSQRGMPNIENAVSTGYAEGIITNLGQEPKGYYIMIGHEKYILYQDELAYGMPDELFAKFKEVILVFLDNDVAPSFPISLLPNSKEVIV
jgi:prepilin-type N-terminal cleavage/methylation domain-containing protein